MEYSQPLASDESLRAAILNVFAGDARTATASLRVGVLNGIVHLAGNLHSLEIRNAAEELAHSVNGVRGVVNRIEAPGAPSPARTVDLSSQTKRNEMGRFLNKIASGLALVIGVTAVFAGGKVLPGSVPGNSVIDWLPVYNFSLGVVSLFVSIVIWNSGRFGTIAAAGILSLHAIVMLVLQLGYRDVVAVESVRLAVWIVIVMLLSIQQRKVRSPRATASS